MPCGFSNTEKDNVRMQVVLIFCFKTTNKLRNYFFYFLDIFLSLLYSFYWNLLGWRKSIFGEKWFCFGKGKGPVDVDNRKSSQVLMVQSSAHGASERWWGRKEVGLSKTMKTGGMFLKSSQLLPLCSSWWSWGEQLIFHVPPWCMMPQQAQNSKAMQLWTVSSEAISQNKHFLILSCLS